MSLIKINNRSLVASSDSNALRVSDLNEPRTFGRKNLLDNGSFSVWQRYTSSSNHSGKGPCDRWRTNYNDCSGNYTREVDGPSNEFQYCLQMIKSGSSNGSMSTQQNVPHDLTKACRGKYITLSVYAKAQGTTQADHRLSLTFGLFRTTDYNGWANNANGSGEDGFYAKSFFFDGRAITTTTQGANSNSALHVAHGSNTQLTTSWQRFSMTIGPIAETTNTIIPQIFSEVTAQNGGIRITGAQLEIFDQNHYDPTSYDLRSFADELKTCQQYFCKSYRYADAIGTATRTGAHGWINANSANGEQTSWQFPTTMRNTPTMSFWSPGDGSSGNCKAYSSGNTGNHSMGTNEYSNTGFTGGSTLGGNNGHLGFVQWAADADF